MNVLTWQLPVSQFAIALIACTSAADGCSAPHDDVRGVVAALDTRYQAAVKQHDAAVMGSILADDFVLISGKGRAFSKADLLAEARSPEVIYEHQEDSARTVRVWGNTAVVTALLWAKGTRNGEPFEYRVWFSDVYLNGPEGWRYVFAQAAQPLAPVP